MVSENVHLVPIDQRDPLMDLGNPVRYLQDPLRGSMGTFQESTGPTQCPWEYS